MAGDIPVKCATFVTYMFCFAHGSVYVTAVWGERRWATAWTHPMCVQSVGLYIMFEYTLVRRYSLHVECTVGDASPHRVEQEAHQWQHHSAESLCVIDAAHVGRSTKARQLGRFRGYRWITRVTQRVTALLIEGHNGQL